MSREEAQQDPSEIRHEAVLVLHAAGWDAGKIGIALRFKLTYVSRIVSPQRWVYSLPNDLNDLDLSERTRNAIIALGVKSKAELQQRLMELAALKGVGKKTLEEVAIVLGIAALPSPY